MIIRPSIRNNFFTNAHPEGCKITLENQINEAKQQEPFDGPKNVLIIGGSSGYGLASRISLAYGSNANTVNVSFESAPRGKRTGSAGFWNNVFFQHFAKETGNIHKDFLGDAFSPETKELVLNYVKDTFDGLDLIVYSLASGVRKNFNTGETVRSSIKSLGEPVVGTTIDIASMTAYELEVLPASEQEVKDTVYVMGGSDWADWVHTFGEAGVLNQGFKTIAYTYIGGPTTENIYRRGSLGQAKEDLEAHAYQMNQKLQEQYNGEALISSSKAVVSKASVFIPQLPIYCACLFDVMKERKIHETILEHKYRLFKDMVYGEQRIIDNKGRIRLDHLEMDPSVQEDVTNRMEHVTKENLFSLQGTKDFIHEFFQINGFNIDSIDYEADVDIDEYVTKYVPKDLQI
ncbi:enoyl-ACP reductase FabV [Candidatus Xianfuyuplasma coldseepsis]|uniref:trans-2-enoyl-CoA reductase (NAD(+)) n=1 Tax=Candidatus Xianfuyuplasma coldseepsis TaxID=2782163 RepID=A0A7L7KR12_9MOLU|nr:enoyl-ACP reductase FabV [Xianfuyuplasma coldseepsis]QMS84722.1 trans-2-enoyl-CoA reductase family protein [Xianfuyuplasma coldseepsis]